MHLLEFTDSTLPVGTFSFSNGLETAAEQRLVHDAATLETYTREVALQAAFSDGVAALHAFRAYHLRAYPAILEADRQVILCKMNAEARQMTQRMGRKLAELSGEIFRDSMLRTWLEQIRSQQTPGCYPVAQALVYARCGISETALFCAHQYGVMSMVLSAALRCVRVSHYDTQRILFRLSEQMQDLYDEARQMSLDDMYTFVPQVDILASLHEKGTQRMFMN
ncbi:MAG: urease accessory UreF family protein [Alistipes sp.]|nr:urease accessory UreF family protein [Alistipes sp.]